MEKKTILVVDDCAAFRDSFRQALKTVSWVGEILEAEDGASAIRMVHDRVPDLIFMDITMPGMNGIEAVRRILDDRPAMKIIMVTVNSSHSLLHESLEAGAMGYLVKNDIYRELELAVETVMTGERFVSKSMKNS